MGGVVHLLISLFWARVLQGALRGITGSGRALTAGATSGAGIAVLDLGLVARLLPPIRALDGAPLVADHIAFGAIVGWILRRHH